MKKIKNMKRSWFKLGLCLILIVAFGLRFFRLGQVPVSLYWDEAAILADAKVVAETGRDMHDHSWLQALFPSYGDYKLPVYIWLTSLAVKLFGVTPWVVRLPSALAGVATVYLAGLIAKKLTDDQAQGRCWQFWSMLVMAVSPWSILFSRTAFEGHLAQFFLGAAVYLLLLAKAKARTKKSWWLFLASILMGLAATYTYFSVRFIWPPLLVLLLWLDLTPAPQSKSKNGKPLTMGGKFVRTIFMLSLFLIGLWPMLRSPFYAASEEIRYSTPSLLSIDSPVLMQNQIRELAGNTSLDRVLFHRAWFWLRDLGRNLSDQLSLNFLFVSGDPNLRHGTGYHGLFLGWSLPFFLLGLYQLAKKRRRVLILLVGWWLLAQLPAIVPLTTPHALRSLNALMPLSLIIAYGLAVSWKWLRQELTGLTKLFGQSLLIALIIICSSAFCYHYFTQYKIDASSSFQDGHRQLAEIIVEQKDEVDQVLVSGFDDRFYLWLWLTDEFSAEEIQAAEKVNYRPEQIDSIHFNIVKALITASEKESSSLVVGDKAVLLEQLQQLEPERVTELAAVSSLDGFKEYLVLKVSAKP